MNQQLDALTPGDIANETFQLFRRRLGLIAGVAFAVQLPYFAFIVAMAFGGYLGPELGEDTRDLLKTTTGVVTTITCLSVTCAASATYENSAMSVWGAYRQGLAAFILVAITQAVVGLALLGLTVLLIVPALYFGPYWALAYTVTTLEGVSGWSAMKRSRTLVRGHWQLVAVTCALGVGIPGAFYYAVLSGFAYLRMTWAWLAWVFGVSFFVTQLVVLYHRLRASGPPTATSAEPPALHNPVQSTSPRD